MHWLTYMTNVCRSDVSDKGDEDPVKEKTPHVGGNRKTGNSTGKRKSGNDDNDDGYDAKTAKKVRNEFGDEQLKAIKELLASSAAITTEHSTRIQSIVGDIQIVASAAQEGIQKLGNSQVIFSTIEICLYCMFNF